ncbi:MAG: hypothetical protein VB095_07145 [Anaerovorax sp.]|nr:hypothetical protein [Anaerovorax sp.]
MICKHCGGQLKDGSKYCGFCQAEVNAPISEEEEKNKHIEDCLGISDREQEGPTWWEEGCGDGENGGCGHGLTGNDKDLKYAFTIVGLVVGVIILTLAVKTLSGLF